MNTQHFNGKNSRTKTIVYVDDRKTRRAAAKRSMQGYLASLSHSITHG